MKKTKTKVIIVIPVHNEGKNIRGLLMNLLAQDRSLFILKKILIISDGSDDKTVDECKKVASNLTIVIDGKKRLGKNKRVNDAILSFKKDSADILIQIDADVLPSNNKVIKSLISPILSYNNVGLVCGTHKPINPKTFIEKIAFFGYKTWNRAILYAGDSERYYCTGDIRAFSKLFLQDFYLPKNVYSVEDVYSYYFAQANNFQVKLAKKACVHFKLVDNFYDYVKQMKRFLGAKSNMENLFGNKMVQKYEVINNSIRLKALIYEGLKSPFFAGCYLFMQLIVRFINNREQSGPWSIARSTKTNLKIAT